LQSVGISVLQINEVEVGLFFITMAKNGKNLVNNFFFFYLSKKNILIFNRLIKGPIPIVSIDIIGHALR
jgi:hypothetical protein